MKQLKAESLFELKTVTNPTLSADGKTAVVVVTEMNQEKNDYIANLHSFNPSESKQETVQLTYGEDKNITPKWAPAGEKLAFLSNRSGKLQLFVKDGLADAKQLTDEKQGVLSFVWSAGGNKIAYTSMRKEKTNGDSATDIPTPVIVDEMKYKSDARGLHDGSVVQVGLLDLINGEQKWLTKAPYDVQLIDFSADSNAVLVAGNRSANRDFTFSSDVWFIDVTTLEEAMVTKEPLALKGGAVSPNGQHVVLLGDYREYENATQPSLYLFDLQSKSSQSLSVATDVWIGDAVVGDFLQNTGSNQLVFSKDGNAVLTLVSEQGHVNLWSYQLDGSVQKLSALEGHVNGFAVQNEEMVITYSDINKPSEAYRLNAPGGPLDLMTALNIEIEQTFEFNLPEPIHFTREDGSFVDGWIMKPNGFEKGQTYPLILEVHGGPHAMYAKTYFHEFQVLTAKGYGVLFTNPRGGLGYGQSFVDAVRGDYGNGDFQDLMDVLDYAIEEHNWIDTNRLGITGGSYGGFMTNWVVGHTNRFKAAVTQRSISNWISFYGVSDIGYYFSEWQIKANLTDLETLWDHSPLKYVKAINTPLLILHGENDLRCPIEQAEQLFIALKKQEKETCFIRFPQANHELSRSGKPNLRIERLNAITSWFDQYL